MDLEIGLQEAIRLCREAGQLALETRGQMGEARYKHEKDVVTEADMRCDRHIRSELQRIFPGHNLVTEEHPDLEAGGEYTWHVDPIDGTINFSRNIPLWGVSIAAAINGRAQIGVIHLPQLGETFTVQRGRGAFCNNLPIRCSSVSDLSRAVISNGDFNVGGDVATRARLNEVSLRNRQRQAAALQRVKCLGSAVVEAAYVACGRLDAYCMTSFHSWDVAAGSLLVEEAGGRVSTLEGGAWKLESQNALFSNGVLHEGLLKLLE